MGNTYLRLCGATLNNVCYSLPIFTVLDAHQIQIQVQLSHQTLTKAHYVSCTILQNGRTSIFSHQIGIIDKNEELHFPENSLPSINLTDLLHPKIDQNTRKIGISDLILDQLYPIYAEKLISLQCLTPKFIFVDNKKKFCDTTTLSFQKIPEIIQIDGQTLTPHIIPKRFSEKLKFANTDFRGVTFFHRTKMTKPSIIKDVTSFFQTATPVKYSLILVSFVSIVLVSLLLLCACYLKIPKVLTKILCCVSNTCCLKRKALKRTRDQDQLRVIYTVAHDLQPAQANVVPSAPVECTLPSVAPTADIPMTSYYNPQTQVSGNCVNNLPGCFCARFGINRPIMCMKN